MRQKQTIFGFHPALLVALSVTLCGASFSDAAAAGPVRAPERVVEAAPGREAVAVLLSCLEDAAKELRQQGGKIAAALPMPTGVAASRLIRPLLPSAVADAPPPACPVLVHHLNLPPPCRAA